MGQQSPPGAKKKELPFSKIILDHMESQKMCSLVRFQLVGARFGPPTIPKCLENGLFWDKKWVKNVFLQKSS